MLAGGCFWGVQGVFQHVVGVTRAVSGYAVFSQNAGQARIARAYIAQLDRERVFGRRIVTTVELNKPFFDAEAYHQDYLTLNPDELYIVINDLPKVGHLKRLFPMQYRDEPVLVGTKN